MSRAKKKIINDFSGIMFSTDPSYIFDNQYSETQTLPPDQQDLRVMLDKKNRGGKAVTLITGFIGTTTDLEALAKKLKTKCGVGGSCKNGIILLQGDFREKAMDFLLKNSYKAKKPGG